MLNKIGLIIKTRNGVTKARMILDTKESGVKKVASKTQRVTLPRLFDAVLRMLRLLALRTPDDADTTSSFVLDFRDTFWQIPSHPEEQRFYCATAVLKGERNVLASSEQRRAVRMHRRYGVESQL